MAINATSYMTPNLGARLQRYAQHCGQVIEMNQEGVILGCGSGKKWKKCHYPERSSG